MEREVYEELKMKKEVERFMKKSKADDDLKASVKLPEMSDSTRYINSGNKL